MKILYYDCFAGISGDMNLGAMVDLGVSKKHLTNQLSKLKLSGYKLKIYKEKRNSIEGTKVDVVLTDSNANKTHKFKLVTSQNSLLKKQPHSHGDQRNFIDIKKLILDSTLSENIKNISIDIFKSVAKAEAKVHGTTVEKIHFHEVGAVDSIVDIVGAAICIDYLKVDKIMASTVELGGGFVKCQHGIIPVPAPATVEILKNIPTKKGITEYEMTTPTGAAILSTLVENFEDKINFKIQNIGIGIGGQKLEIPNILRAYIAEIDESNNKNYSKIKSIHLECNIDDMNPEQYEYVMNKLFENGADDVYLTPIVMKKSRPATMLSVLCSLENELKLTEIIFLETTTLGVRKNSIEKLTLLRKTKIVSTKYGSFNIKQGYFGNKIIKHKPEFEECSNAAKKYGVPISDIYLELNKIIGIDNE